MPLIDPPQPPQPPHETPWVPRDMVMESEKMCEFCKIPEPYAAERTCDGGAHKFSSTGRSCPPPVLSGRGEFRINPLKRLIGYEIEVSECRDGSRVNSLAQKYGAGLCHDGGMFEMNPPPGNGDKLVSMLKDISTQLREAGVKAGTRDGLHTHIDCRDLSWEDIRKVCVLYGKTEPALYSLIDPRRFTANSQRGGFSKPVGGPGLVRMMSSPITAKEDIINFVFGSKENMLESRGNGKQPRGGDRYLGLNLYSWWIRGTIEFRMHHGTTRWEKMLYWGMLLGGMVQTAVDKGGKTIADWPVGKEGMLAYAPTDDCRKWVNDRWDYFAKKRKNKNQPALLVQAVDGHHEEPESDND